MGDDIVNHIKTHPGTSRTDSATVTVLKYYLSSNGKINTDFKENDKWPNVDGVFEYVSCPLLSQRPEQRFIVQIKGTKNYEETKAGIKFTLKDLAFPAYIFEKVSLDPGILFVVLNPKERGKERVFWKYMSLDFLYSIDFSKSSCTILFSSDEEIEKTEESVNNFCEKLSRVIEAHNFSLQLDGREYSVHDAELNIYKYERKICKAIDLMKASNAPKDFIYSDFLDLLRGLCPSLLIYTEAVKRKESASIRAAYEHAIMRADTRYMGTFFRGLQYIGNSFLDEEQSERLLLKYYNFLWAVKNDFKRKYGLQILNNLDDFPLKVDKLDNEYYQAVVGAINAINATHKRFSTLRFEIRKKIPFFINGERYFEITLQLSNIYATKYNRITAFTKDDIPSSYSIQIATENACIKLWDVPTNIKIITAWRVSIYPSCLNKLGKILGSPLKLSSKYGEYEALMSFLTESGMNLLDMIDLDEDNFNYIVESIYQNTNTNKFRKILEKLKSDFKQDSMVFGCRVVRYLLCNLHESTIENVLPENTFALLNKSGYPYLSTKCFPFEKNPFISNLVGSKTSEGRAVKTVARAVGYNLYNVARPYLCIKEKISQTGEIYFKKDFIASDNAIKDYNESLDDWERGQGYSIKELKDYVYISSYEDATVRILQELFNRSRSAHSEQRSINSKYLKDNKGLIDDPLKRKILEDVFVNSDVLLVYGAAGTGKTTLINYISNLMHNKKKLFLTKTHSSLQNLKRNIDEHDSNSEFLTIDSYNKKRTEIYDVIFIDECSVVDNLTMVDFFKKLLPDTLLVLSGDIYQIEPIEYGNWFYFAKDLVTQEGANIELTQTWRTKEQSLISLWDEVRRRKSLITEKLVIDGHFSENIGEGILSSYADDEVVLCLNYDGKFGLNSLNSYFQNANPNKKVFSWGEWTYKVGDPILFNETDRFPLLYNNLKGYIVDIQRDDTSITFSIEIEMMLFPYECVSQEFQVIRVDRQAARSLIRFSVYEFDESSSETTEEERRRSIVPFQLAYAVSIHKAQGLEYDSVKVVIPSSNSEKITHGIFYTAITRAKKSLKIYWSAETMRDVITGFTSEETKRTSLDIIKSKIKEDNANQKSISTSYSSAISCR